MESCGKVSYMHPGEEFLTFAQQTKGKQGKGGPGDVKSPDRYEHLCGGGLRQQIGQMLMIGFRGITVHADSPIVRDIVERHIGGVVIYDYDVELKKFGRNVESPNQLKDLTEALHEFSSTRLLVAVDQEGGKVARLKESYGFPPTESAESLGSTDIDLLTYLHSSLIADTLLKNGINMNLAPVVDVNVDPDSPAIGRYGRSFSSEPHAVVGHASAFIEAHHDMEILTTLKHFPGHGSATADSHFGFTDVTATWSEAELEPYAELVSAGLADVVMTAHVFNSNIDPEFPATLSSNAIKGILRDKLGFDGVVISDDMQMGAVTDQYGLETAILRSLEAGVDMLLFSNNMAYEEDIAERAIQIVLGAVESGQISCEQIKKSGERIRLLKEKLN
ncbi:MAG TPA: glycoside hydrolase family 3 protein [bacterium]|nr:glycoside hydrolase family 3 protein [bacterium]